MTATRRRTVLALFAAMTVALAVLAPSFAEVAPGPAPIVGLWGTGPGPGLGDAP